MQLNQMQLPETIKQCYTQTFLWQPVKSAKNNSSISIIMVNLRKLPAIIRLFLHTWILTYFIKLTCQSLYIEKRLETFTLTLGLSCRSMIGWIRQFGNMAEYYFVFGRYLTNCSTTCMSRGLLLGLWKVSILCTTQEWLSFSVSFLILWWIFQHMTHFSPSKLKHTVQNHTHHCVYIYYLFLV